jgi:hypothetical protein
MNLAAFAGMAVLIATAAAASRIDVFIACSFGSGLWL